MGLDPGKFALFVGSAIVLLVTPGPAVLFLVTQSFSHGVRGGLASALGLFAGGVVHMLAAIAYLVYLGIREFTGKQPPRNAQPVSGELKSVVARAAWVNILNPKAALFFLAFLPQFVQPGAGNVTAQLALLGATFLALAVVTDLSYVLLSGLVRRRLPRGTGRSRVGRFATGSVYVSLGLAAAFGGSGDSGP